MKELILGIGGNQKNRIENLDKCRNLIEERLGLISKASSIFESEPWGFDSQLWFLNQVLVLNSENDPLRVLKIIHEIEHDLGRVRTSVYSDRPVDVDILFYGDLILNDPLLQIPHKHLAERKFVLEPLVELIPEFIHPVLKLSCQELLEKCDDTSGCRKLIV